MKGTVQILRFNWPSYTAAIIVMGVCLVTLRGSSLPHWIPLGVLLLALYFSIASLVAAHWIYDRSRLAHWEWIEQWMNGTCARPLLLQIGFDPTYGNLQRQLASKNITVVDLYGTPGMGGVSVERARKANSGRPKEALSTLPQLEGAYDAVFAIFVLHEIRDRVMRETFFRSLGNIIEPGGHLVVIEHRRDWKNFAVFGVGFFHFLSEQDWRRGPATAGLHLEKTMSITPFVKAFLWKKS